MPVTESLTEAAAGLQAIGAEFHSLRWSVGTSSNYSVVVGREPTQLLLTASGKDKGRLGNDDFVLVDAEGKNVRDGDPKPSAETLLHCVLAEHVADVGAILHTHSVWGTLLSQRFFADGGFAIEDFEMLKGLEGVGTHQHREWVPVFDNTQDIPSLSAEIAERFRAADDPSTALGHGFLIRQHGFYTWGKDLFTARRHMEIYEFLFECVARKLAMRIE